MLVMGALAMGLQTQGLCCALVDLGPEQIMLGRTQVVCDVGQDSTNKNCLVLGVYAEMFVVVPLEGGEGDKLFLVRVNTSQGKLQWFWSGDIQDTIAFNYGQIENLLYWNYGPGGGWFGNAVFVDEPVDGSGQEQTYCYLTSPKNPGAGGLRVYRVVENVLDAAGVTLLSLEYVDTERPDNKDVFVTSLDVIDLNEYTVEDDAPYIQPAVVVNGKNLKNGGVENAGCDNYQYAMPEYAYLYYGNGQWSYQYGADFNAISCDFIEHHPDDRFDSDNGPYALGIDRNGRLQYYFGSTAVSRTDPKVGHIYQSRLQREIQVNNGRIEFGPRVGTPSYGWTVWSDENHDMHQDELRDWLDTHWNLNRSGIWFVLKNVNASQSLMDIVANGRGVGDVNPFAACITGKKGKDADAYATAQVFNGIDIYGQPQAVCDAAPGNLAVKIVCLGWPYHYLSYDPKFPDVPQLPEVTVSVGSQNLDTLSLQTGSSVSREKGYQWGKRKLHKFTRNEAFNYSHGWTGELAQNVTLTWTCSWESGISADTYSAYGFTCSTTTAPYLQYYAVEPTASDMITVGGDGLTTPLSFDSLMALAQTDQTSTLYNFSNLHPECRAYKGSPDVCAVEDYNWASLGLPSGKPESILPSTTDKSQIELALNAIMDWQRSSDVQLDQLVSLVAKPKSGVSPLQLSFTTKEGAGSNTQLSPITLHLYYGGETNLTVDVSAAEGETQAGQYEWGWQYHVEPNPNPPKPPIPPAAGETSEDEAGLLGAAHRIKDQKRSHSYSASWDKQSGKDVSLAITWYSSRYPDYYFDYYYLRVDVPKLKSYLIGLQGETVQRPPWVPSYCWATGDSFMILFPYVAGIEPVVSFVPHR